MTGTGRDIRDLEMELLDLYGRVEGRMEQALSHDDVWAPLVGGAAGTVLGTVVGRKAAAEQSPAALSAWTFGGGVVGWLCSQALLEYRSSAAKSETAASLPPEEAVLAFQRLRSLRNRLLHDMSEGPRLSAAELAALRADIEPLVRWIEALEEPASSRGAVVVPSPTAADEVKEEPFWGRIHRRFHEIAESVKEELENVLPQDPPEWSGAEPVVELVARHDGNVTALTGILNEHLEEREKARLIRKLKSQKKYIGEDMGILCEYCLEADPLAILTDHFNVTSLEEIAAQIRCLVPAAADKEATARAILCCLGFTVCDPPRGLRHVRAEVDRLQQEAELAQDREGWIGCVHAMDMEMERILHGLITFYGPMLWGSHCWKEFAEWNPAFKEKRMTLGARCNLLLKMETEIRKDGLPARRLHELFQERKEIIGRDALVAFNKIIPKRASFAHFRDETDQEPDAAVRLRALELFERCDLFLKHLKEGGIYPMLVIADELVQDRFGRCYITCRRDDGRKEKVFTDQELVPNKQYFLHPRTNPVRVFPVIVPYQDAV